MYSTRERVSSLGWPTDRLPLGTTFRSETLSLLQMQGEPPHFLHLLLASMNFEETALDSG